MQAVLAAAGALAVSCCVRSLLRTSICNAARAATVALVGRAREWCTTESSASAMTTHENARAGVLWRHQFGRDREGQCQELHDQDGQRSRAST